MILLDASGTFFAALHADLKDNKEPDFSQIQHIILNMIRSYNAKFRHSYGNMVICFDSHSWRQDVFPEYKWVRKNAKDDSKLDWGQIMKYFTDIQKDITNNFPYQTVQTQGAEADDIIGVLTKDIKEKTLIISNDKDLVACTKNLSVDMYRPYAKSMFSVDDSIRFEFELIISGDKVDGVPNIKCSDDFFKKQQQDKEKGIKPLRSPAVTQKLKDELWICYNTNVLRDKLEELGYTKNYLRNWKLIGINNQPNILVNQIKSEFNKKHGLNSDGKTLQYLQKHKMYLLAKCCSDFYPSKLKDNQ